MTAPDRVPCIVPFCRRTAPREKMPDAIEMLCGKCGRRAPRERKFWRACERHRKAEAALGLDLTRKQWRRYDRAWSRLVAAAVAASANAPPVTHTKRKSHALRKPRTRASLAAAATQRAPRSP
mgnify:CR=1 FL=1